MLSLHIDQAPDPITTEEPHIKIWSLTFKSKPQNIPRPTTTVVLPIPLSNRAPRNIQTTNLIHTIAELHV